jgi:hypothetical protein
MFLSIEQRAEKQEVCENIFWYTLIGFDGSASARGVIVSPSP